MTGLLGPSIREPDGPAATGGSVRSRPARTAGQWLALLAVLASMVGCGTSRRADSSASQGSEPSRSITPTLRTALTHGATTPVTGAGRPRSSVPTRTRVTRPDPRWRFWVTDTRHYTSPWYRGTSRMMIGFGCTRAPYYPVDPSCPHHEGSHHGIDMALACRTPLFAGLAGVVVSATAAGALGPAYGPWAFRIRTLDGRFDVVIGHVRKVFVHAGDTVRPGQLIALAGDAAAPDGCHLHFEERPAGTSYTSAINPRRLLRLRAAR